MCGTALSELTRQTTDSYDEFRSDFVHFSISVTSPIPDEPARDIDGRCESAWPGIKARKTTEANGFHFAPGLMARFWSVWRLFDSAMSLPIRTGTLFPSPQPPSKKFGRHTATIKYRLDIASLYLAHTYRQDSAADWPRGLTTVLGVKGRVGHLRIDLHQRAQEETIQRSERRGRDETTTVQHKRFYEAEIDAIDIQACVLHATFHDPIKALVPRFEGHHDDDDPSINLPGEHEPFEHRDEWIDADDYNDVGFEPVAPFTPSERDTSAHAAATERIDEPKYRVQRFMTCPRMTYYRRPVHSGDKPDSEGSEDGDGEGGRTEAAPPPRSKFGDEGSHLCLIGNATGPIEVQIDLTAKRAAELQAKLDSGKDVRR